MVTTRDAVPHARFVPSREQLTPVSVLLSLAPSLVYLAAHAAAGPGAAMVAASVSAAGVLLVRRRQRSSVGFLLPVTLAYLLLRTALGLATGSDLLYFGGGLLLSALAAIGVGVTALTRTPAAVHLIPLVSNYRHLTSEHPGYRRIAAHVTAVWAVAELVTVGVELQHLLHSGGAAYVQSRTTVVLPAMAGLVWLLIFYVRARLDPIEFRLAQGHGRSRANRPDQGSAPSSTTRARSRQISPTTRSRAGRSPSASTPGPETARAPST